MFNATALFKDADKRFQTQLASLKLYDVSGPPSKDRTVPGFAMRSLFFCSLLLNKTKKAESVDWGTDVVQCLVAQLEFR